MDVADTVKLRARPGLPGRARRRS